MLFLSIFSFLPHSCFYSEHFLPLICWCAFKKLLSHLLTRLPSKY